MYEGEGSNGRTVLSEDDAEENVLPLIEVHRGGSIVEGRWVSVVTKKVLTLGPIQLVCRAAVCE